tara:strand:+ start:1479 stop:1856 length:378 start_codon:yes stop_codon:yes gene_type:complete
MIFGIGTDIVEINRIRKMKNLERFAKKILSNNELAIYTTLSKEASIFFLSKQFAAKEAFAKALGTGIRDEIKFCNIEVKRNKNGKPTIMALNELKSLMQNFGIKRTHVSLSDETQYAISFVMLEK